MRQRVQRKKFSIVQVNWSGTRVVRDSNFRLLMEWNTRSFVDLRQEISILNRLSISEHNIKAHKNRVANSSSLQIFRHGDDPRKIFLHFLRSVGLQNILP